MNTNNLRVFRYTDIVIAVFTGFLAVVFFWDLVDFITSPEGYERLFGMGGSLGCNYQSPENYKIFAIARTISMTTAFISGFFFKDKRWALCVRLCFVALAYLLEYVLTIKLC